MAPSHKKSSKEKRRESKSSDVAMEGGEEDGGNHAGVEHYVSPIAHPMANDKLAKRALKLVKKASKAKKLRRGVKEVVKAIRKNEKGICLFAGNISPIDVISHMPVLCEDNGIAYIYVPTKEELGASALTKRPTSCVLVPHALKEDDEYEEKAKEVLKGIKDATPAL